MNRSPVLVDVALQGGGSHGAFTWGVLDRLLRDNALDIRAISGTSAGAMNAAVLADGLIRGGAEEARAALRRFWHAIGEMPGLASLSTAPFGGLGRAFGATGAERVWHLDQSPAYLFF